MTKKLNTEHVQEKGNNGTESIYVVSKQHFPKKNQIIISSVHDKIFGSDVQSQDNM